MTAAAKQAVAEPDPAGWCVADPEAGDPVFVCPWCWPTVGSGVLAGADGREGARAGASAGVGALRRVRSRAGVLMRADQESPVGTV